MKSNKVIGIIDAIFAGAFIFSISFDMDFDEPQKEDYLPGAASFVFRIQLIDSEIAAKQNAELREAVEDFAEHVYAEGSEVDGLKFIFHNPRARAAFIKFLNILYTMQAVTL